MRWQHEKILRLSSWPTKVDAALYNLATRAVARFGGELRLSIRGVKTYDVIVRNDAWIIVDRAANDQPIAAWVDFQGASERGLHEPVICELRYYQNNASLVIKRVLRRMEEEFHVLLDSGADRQDGSVIAFRAKDEGL